MLGAKPSLHAAPGGVREMESTMTTPADFASFYSFNLTLGGGILADYANSAINGEEVAY